MDRAEIEKHVNPNTGLVPLTILTAFAPYTAGSVAGFPPEIAVQHVNNQAAEIHKAPSKNEVARVARAETLARAADHAPVLGHVPQVRRTIYDNRPEVTPQAQVAPEGYNTVATNPLQPAAIPDGWTDLPGNEKRKLAATLSQRLYQELSVAASEEIIQAAIDARPHTVPPRRVTDSEIDA